jgi:NitT/TauT family transport system ATP-binding protein
MPSKSDKDDATPILTVTHMGFVYGKGAQAFRAIEDISFTVRPREFVSIVGPSGCGKTTLLKSMCGLLSCTSGSTAVNDVEVKSPPRDVALVFQEYTKSLLPWLTVEKNVTFPLAAAGIPAAVQHARAEKALHEVGLDGFASKYPWQLSGGMQQRTAIARAIAYEPKVLLMDEPFASVDAQTRADLEDLVLRVQQDTGVTIVFVTHDIDESVYLGHRVIVLSRRPTRVLREVVVPLSRPRNQVDTKADPEFVRLRTEILRLIRSE